MMHARLLKMGTKSISSKDKQKSFPDCRSDMNVNNVSGAWIRWHVPITKI